MSHPEAIGPVGNAPAEIQAFMSGSLVTEPQPTGNVSTPEPRSLLAIDPLTLSPEDFQKLDDSGQNQVLLQLFRAAEDPASTAKVAELRPGFEMQYPLSDFERNEFASWKAYSEFGIGALRPDRQDTLIDAGTLDVLDELKRTGTISEASLADDPTRMFKIDRYRRYLLEEQVRQEREEAKRKQAAVPQTTQQPQLDTDIRRAA